MNLKETPHDSCAGILLIDKPKGLTSFRLVQILRKKLNVKKIGHAGTLDPFATGLMVMLVGRTYTRLSDSLLTNDKEYIAELFLGKSTDTYDEEGEIQTESTFIPSLKEVEEALLSFQGELLQIPPMFSAKKVKGKRLYELARKGIEIERQPVKVSVKTTLIRYEYPTLILNISCSKGTYIRSIAHDLGKQLRCGAHLTNLRRTQSGPFRIETCISSEDFLSPTFNLQEKLIKDI